MIEIKFRVWDKQNNKYYYGNSDPAVIQGVIFLNPRYIVEQFTSLYDCNGKEIYEGDILQNIINKNTKNLKGFIEFKDAAFCIKFDECPINNLMSRITSQDYKVIGNIHK